MTNRFNKPLLVLVSLLAISAAMTGCSGAAPSSSATSQQAQVTPSPSTPAQPVALCVAVLEEAVPFAGPATYNAWFASQEDYDRVVKALLAEGFTPLEGGDGLQVRFEVTPDDLSDFLSPADKALLDSLTEPYHLVTNYASEACTTTA